MALIPIISQTWDTTSVFNPTRMNNIEQNLAIVSDATGVKYSNGVSVKDKIDSMALKKVWSGSIYQDNDTFQITNFETNRIYHFIFRGFSGSYTEEFDVLISGSESVDHQFIIQGDSTQYCRYRITINPTTGAGTIVQALGSATNSDLVAIYKKPLAAVY